MLKTMLIAALLAACVASVAQSQGTDILANGMRIRLSPETGKKIAGTIVRMTCDSIYLSSGASESAPSAVGHASIHVVELSGGKSRVTGAPKGAGLAVFMGGALGALYGSLQPKPVERHGFASLIYLCISHTGTIRLQE